MTAAGGLEAGYRWLLRWYPPSYRGRHGDEILGVLMAAARPGQRRPGARESLDLLWSALRIRTRMILRGADSQPWADALALAAVLLPLLMLLLKLTEFLCAGARYGFGSPADILIGAYGQPGAYAQSFQLNSYSVALSGNVTDALTKGPLPVFLLAVLVCLGWRRAGAVLAAFVPLAFLGISLTNGYTLLAGPRGDVTLYAFALEALILVITPGTARGWRALQWRPAVLLGAATVAAGVGMNGGLWPLFHAAPAFPAFPLDRAERLALRAQIPHGFIGRLFGVGTGQWGDWLLYQGTLVAVIAVALIFMLASSPVSRRALFLLAIPFALGAVIYLCSLIRPPPPASAGNALAVSPLLLFLLAAVVSGWDMGAALDRMSRAARQHPGAPDRHATPSRPAVSPSPGCARGGVPSVGRKP
jgi:hypothetical protein